jgi:hypothetical protein
LSGATLIFDHKSQCPSVRWRWSGTPVWQIPLFAINDCITIGLPD